jgi:excisionase family DNA binding protein
MHCIEISARQLACSGYKLSVMATKAPPRTGKQLSVRQVAEIYGVNQRTVRRWIDRGFLTAYRVGSKTLRLDSDQVREQLESERTA